MPPPPPGVEFQTPTDSVSASSNATHNPSVLQKSLPPQPLDEMMQKSSEHGSTPSPEKEMVDQVSVCSVEPPYVLPPCPVKKSSNPCKKAVSKEEEDTSVCSVEEPPSL